eukprot:2558764-Alexandrium_andersonii.AAC.1
MRHPLSGRADLATAWQAACQEAENVERLRKPTRREEYLPLSSVPGKEAAPARAALTPGLKRPAVQAPDRLPVHRHARAP